MPALPPMPPVNYTDSGPVAAPQKNDFFAPNTFNVGAKGAPFWAWLAVGAAAVLFLMKVVR